MRELFYIKMVSKTSAIACGIAALLTTAATVGFVGNGIRTQNIVRAERARLDEQSATIAGFENGLSIQGSGGHYSPDGSSVIVKGNSVVMLPAGYSLDSQNQPRFYGMTREQAQEYVGNQQQRLYAQKSLLRNLETQL